MNFSVSRLLSCEMGKSDTKRLKQIMTSAGEEARRLGNSKIYPEHLFLGLLRLNQGRAIDVLVALGLDFYEVKERIEKKLEKKRDKMDDSELDFTLASNSILKKVMEEALKLGDEQIESEHVMLAILRVESGFVSKLFKTMGIDYDVFKEQLLKERARMQSDYKEDSDEDEDMGETIRFIILIVSRERADRIRPYWIISGSISPGLRKRERWIRLSVVNGKLNVWLRY